MPPKKQQRGRQQQAPGEKISDPRFQRVHNDPRFLRAKKRDTKVKIDKRFQSMLSSKDFAGGSDRLVDKYGRPLAADSTEKELKRFYDMDEDEEADVDDNGLSLEAMEKAIMEDEGNLADEVSSSDEEDDDMRPLALGDKGYDPMRGKGLVDSSDEESSDDEEAEDEEEQDERDKIPQIAVGDETRRLAVVNLDWDKIKSTDLYRVLTEFKPKTGIIESVTVYPSEFGKERMEREDREGPPKEIFSKNAKGDEDDESSDEEITEKTLIRDQVEEGQGEDFDQEALRKYQLERLRYFYAVVTCDSASTAKALYQACDGNEYEDSANFFDLRYIPDDMTFDDDEARDTCKQLPSSYRPTRFTTEALQHTKVKLTWDQDEPERTLLTRRNFTDEEMAAFDFDAYLASDSDSDGAGAHGSDDDDADVAAIRAKYLKLLDSGDRRNAYDDADDDAFFQHPGSDDDGDDKDMEITFTPGLSESASAAIEAEKEEEKEETTIEKYMRKQKEKRMAKKDRRLQQQEEEEEQDAKNKKKNKKKKPTKEERMEQKRQKAELALMMDDDEQGEGFDMKQVLKMEKLEKKNKKSRKEKDALAANKDDFEIDVADPRFAALQDSHHFAIDPTHSQFKKTKSMKKIMEARTAKLTTADTWKKEKQKKAPAAPAADEPKKTKKNDLSQLVSAVKRKGALANAPQGKRQKKQQA
ncbi:hypothetical protein BC940DRAFT_320076 [Gongronella butleri]|nr:hypothetical protein BC940DRAFT_320076 [Gongronella butleri]